MNDNISVITVARILLMISNTSGTLEKERLLNKFGSVPGVKETLHFLFNGYITTGIKSSKLEKAMMYKSTQPVLSLLDLFAFLEKNNTGTMDAVSVAARFLSYWSDKSLHEKDWATTRWLAEGIITKNLQIGLKSTKLNKIFGKGFIPVVGIMRGMQAPKDFRGTYIATEKIDGNRRLIMNKASGVEIYTRSGKRDYGLIEIEEQVARLPVGYAYDTEGTKIGVFKNNVECRQQSASIFNSDGIRRGVKVQIFDMLPIEEYEAGFSTLNAVERKLLLCILFGDTNGSDVLSKLVRTGVSVSNAIKAIKISPVNEAVPYNLPNVEHLPILGIVHNIKEALDMAQPYWDNGKEGLMLNDITGLYEVSPNPRKCLLKIKATVENVLRVVDIYEGTNSNINAMGGVQVEYVATDKKIYYFNVGGGFSAWERDYYWQHPEAIIGTLIEVDSFGESINASGGRALNCAQFKRIKGVEE